MSSIIKELKVKAFYYQLQLLYLTSHSFFLYKVVVSGVAPGPEDVMTYVNCTLLSASMHSAHENNNSVLIESCIEFLQDNEFVTVQKSTNEGNRSVLPFQQTQILQ